MRKKIFITLILWLIILQCSLMKSIFASISLDKVLFLNEPENRLIFEFSNKPKYEILHSDKKLILMLSNTTIRSSNWISSLPKNIFKEFNISLEDQKIILEFTLTKDFYISSEAYENKLIISLISNKDKKITHARIVRDKVETFSVADMAQIQSNLAGQENVPIRLHLSGNYTGYPISVDFQDADLRAIMRLFAEVGKINLLFVDSALNATNTTLTMRVSNVPWDLLFDAILSKFGLIKVKEKNLVLVTSPEHLKRISGSLKDYYSTLRDLEQVEFKETKIYNIRYRKVSEIARRLSALLGKDGIDIVAEFFETATSTGTQVNVAHGLIKIGTRGEKGFIVFDSINQQIIAQAPRRILEEIEKIIKGLDRPAQQILIEARLVEVSDTYSHSFGIRWGGGAYRLTEKTLLGIGNLPNVNRRDSMTSGTGTISTERQDFTIGTMRRGTNEQTMGRTQETTTKDSTTQQTVERNRWATGTVQPGDRPTFHPDPNYDITVRHESLTRQLPTGAWTGTESINIRSGSGRVDQQIYEDTVTRGKESTAVLGDTLKNILTESVSNLADSTRSLREQKSTTQERMRSLDLSLPTGPLIDLGLADKAPRLGFSIGYLGKSLMKIDLELQALEERGVARVIARPRVVTLNNQPAEFKQGFRIPYIETVTEGNQTKETTKFIDAGLRLLVNPHLTPDNRIFLDVWVERATPIWERTVRGIPALYTTSAVTRAIVANGETFVIGGIRLEEIRDSTDQIPGLGNIPGAGRLFRRTGKSSSSTEFMVFITPKIVTAEVEGVDY